MPSTLTYPGVYVEEIPSAVRTITGVATSITAFVGRARRGPIDTPRTINSMADFERIYGGVWSASWLGYAVRDFYNNGGQQAIIVRLFHAAAGGVATTSISYKELGLEAPDPGAWANGLRIRVDHDIADAAADLGIAKTDLFNLTIRDTATGETELHRNLIVKDGPRRADVVLATDSLLLRVKGDLPDAIPDAHGDPPPGKGIWDDDAASTGVDDDAKASDGDALEEDDFTGDGKQAAKAGLFALDQADLFNMLCIPPYKAGDVDANLVGTAATYCETRRAILLVDPPKAWNDKDDAKDNVDKVGTNSKNAALFFPRLRMPDTERGGQIGDFVPGGAVAGVCARTDTTRGVWKAPAGQDAVLRNVPELSVKLTDAENGELNPLGINCLRSLPPAGRVVWGSRTLQGDDRLASEWKYLPVRRTALYIEESLFRGTKWVVFEPNDEPLWASIRLNVGAFMHNLFRQGAFQGKTPKEAYFVKCDKETTTQNDINLGVVNIVVGFAPLKPAEFVVLKLQQMAGQVEV